MERERDPEPTYRCQGCQGTSDNREAMERHEASCVLALRAKVTELESRLWALERVERQRNAIEEGKAYRERQAELDAFEPEFRRRRQAMADRTPREENA